jgi:hypothetical protein
MSMRENAREGLRMLKLVINDIHDIVQNLYDDQWNEVIKV